MKFLQVHTFYDAAIRDIYKDTALRHSSFSKQIDAILKHGFTGTHLIAPYMQRQGYVPALVIANCVWAQHQWLREMGMALQLPDKAIVKYQIEAFKPDVLYIGNPVTYDSRFIRVLKPRPRIVIGWAASSIPPDVDWSEFDIVLSGLHGMREAAMEQGARTATHFLPGFPTWMSRAYYAAPAFDVSFAGQWSAAHTKRNAYLEAIAEHTRAQSKRTCAFYLLDSIPLPSGVARYNRGPRFGRAMCHALRAGAMTIDARGDIGVRTRDLAGTETSNARLFEATGSGAFLLAERHSNLKDMFEVGQEIETFGSKLELTAKLMYYKSHPDVREAIARQGQRRCLRDHSMAARAKQLHQIIQQQEE